MNKKSRRDAAQDMTKAELQSEMARENAELYRSRGSRGFYEGAGGRASAEERGEQQRSTFSWPGITQRPSPSARDVLIPLTKDTATLPASPTAFTVPHSGIASHPHTVPLSPTTATATTTAVAAAATAAAAAVAATADASQFHYCARFSYETLESRK
ncbi:hypothetical protein CC78DRAFT_581086 [Lojkania enalia]|uniref:Uncharacterized protein n=1 Tax=Lojkania enalia TaxID=147567 RepID=A0A9P4K6W8_9PLEO|nr:hypothetical protein CC78DRAFT_581086 [Didymosphaeria enalia]